MSAYRSVLLVLSLFVLMAGSYAEEYRRLLNYMPIGMDPAEMDDIHSVQVMIQVGEGLTTFDSNSLKPAIASRWDISPNQKEYTFYLNPDAKFSNGIPITAQDVVTAFEHILSPESISWKDIATITGAKKFHEGKTRKVSGLTVVSPSVLKVKLKKAFPPFLSILAAPNYVILPKESLAKLASHKIVPFVSSGPYEIAKVDPGKRIELKKNKFYHGTENVYFESVSYDVVENKEVAVQGLIAGKYHDIWPFHADALPSTFNDKLTSIPSITAFTWFLEFNAKDKRVANHDLRKLIASDMDVNGFLEQMKLPASYRANGFIPKGMLGYRDTPRSPSRISEGKVLAGAGCTAAHPCEIEVLYSHEVDSALESLFKPLKRFAPALKIRLSKVQRGDWFKRYTARKFTVAFLGSSVDHHETYFCLRYLLNETYNPGLPAHERKAIANLIEKALHIPDKMRRSQIYAQADELLMEQYIFVPIYHGDIPFRQVRKDIAGYSHSILGYPYLSIMRLRPTQEGKSGIAE